MTESRTICFSHGQIGNKFRNGHIVRLAFNYKNHGVSKTEKKNVSYATQLFVLSHGSRHYNFDAKLRRNMARISISVYFQLNVFRFHSLRR